MAGNSGSEGTPGPESKPKPSAKTFSCTKCGGSVTIRYPGEALFVACDFCHTLLDATDPNYRIVSEYNSKLTYKPRIALGSRGKLFDRLWEVIGFVVRCDYRSRYAWEEYLLFNPYYGYRWLTLADGHWNFVETIKKKPQLSSFGRANTRGSTAILDEKVYKVFYSGEAEVLYVFGEFYWRLSHGERVDMSDYIRPPEMLSREGNLEEVVWSLSRYVEPKIVATAFKITPDALPKRKGIGPNQPSSIQNHWRKLSTSWGFLLIALLCIQVAQIVMAPNHVVLKDKYAFNGDEKRPDITSSVFEVDKDMQNLEVQFDAPINNSWLYIAGDLVNDTTGDSYPFERSIEYYHGYDGGESWSEGGTTQSFIISKLPAGRYYLNMDTENGGFNDHLRREFSVRVTRGVPILSNLLWTLLAVSIYPILIWWRQRAIEVERWSQSDFSPYATGD